MRLVMEIENDQELKQAEKLMKELPITEIIKRKNKKRNIEALIAYSEKNPLPVKKVIIPSREERNER